MSDVSSKLSAHGEQAAGDYYAAWPDGVVDPETAQRTQFQYTGMAHQSDTALGGMWLFLASELLFFGGLFLIYLIMRVTDPAAMAAASQHTELWIGTTNTVLLITSSAVFTWGLGHARLGNNAQLFRACVVVILLGSAFLGLKSFEWLSDIQKGLFPGPHFSITGPHDHGAQLFWGFYFVATGLHGLHMIVGIGLLAWLGWTAGKQRYSRDYVCPVEVVGLYWSFVDMIWLCLYPMLYLVDRTQG